MIADPRDLGRRIARRFIVRGIRPDVRELAAQLEVQVLEQGAPPPAQPGLRSEYRREPPRITLYREAIESLSATIFVDQRFDMLACSLDEVHIAHELFHHLECGQRFGPLRPDEVEEAAHAFTQELLDLTFDPHELSRPQE